MAAVLLALIQTLALLPAAVFADDGDEGEEAAHTFTVRYLYSEGGTALPETVEREKPVVPQHNPSTGLAGHIWLYAGILAAAAAAAAVFMVMRRKRNGE